MSRTIRQVPERVVAVQDRRRSGAAGQHADRRQRRQRTRSAARRAAIRASRQEVA